MPAPDFASPFAVEEIARAAAALPASERAAWLATACAGQPAVRARVERLLLSRTIGAFLRESGSGYERAEPAAEGEDAEHEKAGARFGHYQLVEQIGEGGFGVVWLAEQLEPVQRRVALKILKPGMDTREVIARFEQERQALALMDHPGIARVFDAGATPLGRPYFVMELVRGTPITDYCDRERLSIEERLGLFIAVCQAVQHAHQKGVIHRDLKPSNILVAESDGAPAPKIIDFGVAKAIHAEPLPAFTRTEQMLGTPHYMSPEQVATGGRDLDTRSDIYALGVLLYELLTGRTPFDPAALARMSPEELRRTIREVEPVRPSVAFEGLKGHEGHKGQPDADGPSSPFRPFRPFSTDLDWITLKALEKDRTRRYETASALALDLQRHLHHEPVLARPPSFGYLAGKFVRKYRGRVIASAAVLAALLAGLAVSTVLYLREKAAWSSEAAQRARAEASAATSAQTAQFLQDTLTGFDPLLARHRRPTTLQEILDRAAERVGATFQDQPEVERQLRDTLGLSYNALLVPDAALPQYERALALATTLHGPEHPVTIDALSFVAKTHFAARHYDQAVALREQVVALRRKVLGADHPDTFSALFALAGAYSYAGRPDDALKLREQTLTLTRETRDPDDPRIFQAMNALATSYTATGRHDEALVLQEQVREGTARVLGPENRATLGAMIALANNYGAAGRLTEAIDLQQSALAIGRRVLRPGDDYLVSAMDHLAKLYEQSGRPDDARKMREEVRVFRSKYK